MDAQTSEKRRLEEAAGLYRECLSKTRTLVESGGLEDDTQVAELLTWRRQALTRAGALLKSCRNGAGDPRSRKKYLADIRRSAARMLQEDESIRDRLKKEAGAALEELERLRQGQASLKAYRPYRSNGARYIDRRG